MRSKRFRHLIAHPLLFKNCAALDLGERYRPKPTMPATLNSRDVVTEEPVTPCGRGTGPKTIITVGVSKYVRKASRAALRVNALPRDLSDPEPSPTTGYS